MLAIDIKRSGFDKAVRSAVISSYSEDCGISKEEWQHLVKDSDVRIQWDPEKDVDGNNLPFRSIQLGLRGEVVKEYVNDWIVNITDITDQVKKMNSLRLAHEDISRMLPEERVYILT